MNSAGQKSQGITLTTQQKLDLAAYEKRAHEKALALLNPQIRDFQERQGGDVVLERLPKNNLKDLKWSKKHQGKSIGLAVPEQSAIQQLFAERIPHVVTLSQVTTHTGNTQLASYGGKIGSRNVEFLLEDCGLDFSKWQRLLKVSTARVLHNPHFFLAFTRELFTALMPFHAAGFIHCDLKRDNLCIALTDLPKEVEGALHIELDLSQMKLIDMQFCLTKGARQLPLEEQLAWIHTPAKHLFPQKYVENTKRHDYKPEEGPDFDGLYISPAYMAAADAYAGGVPGRIAGGWK